MTKRVFKQLTRHSALMYMTFSSHRLNFTLLSRGLVPWASSSAVCTEGKLNLDWAFGNCFQLCNQWSLIFCYSKIHDLKAEAYLVVRARSGDALMRTKSHKMLVSQTQLGWHLQPQGSMMMPKARLFLNSQEHCFGG